MKPVILRKIPGLLLVLCLALPVSLARADEEDDSAPPPPKAHHKTEKSAKKQAADNATLNLPAPQVLEKSDSLLGFRFNHGDDFSGASLFGLSFENMVSPNFGLIGQVSYGTYSGSISAGPITGAWNYKVWAFTVMGALHADFLKVPNLDPYVSLGLGHSIYSVSWSSNVGSLAPTTGADSSSFYVAAYLNVRYFLNSNWGLQASLGTGLGLLGLGVDYIF